MRDEYVYEVKLLTQFPATYRTFVELGLQFMFVHPGDCNLSLVRECYANWLTETKYKTVAIRGKDVKFLVRNLNELLDTLNFDYEDLNVRLDSNARWVFSKDTRRYNTCHFANFNLVDRVWLKIVYSMLLPAKHLSEVSRVRVVLITC